MYIEDEHSKNLMKLNAYYKDTRYSNSKMLLLIKFREKVDQTKQLIRNIRNIKKQGIKKTLLQIKAFFNHRLIIDRQFNYDFNHDYELNYQENKLGISSKIVVYTSIFGNYDHLIEPLYKSQYCDYYVITDQIVPANSSWKKYDTSSITDFEELDNYKKSKYCKMFPDILFPEYDYSIWVDGNVQITADMYPFVDRMGDAKMATFNNPLHNCIYTEAIFNVCQNNAKIDELFKQIEKYRSDGFPPKYGMRECTIIARLHSDPECKELMVSWWEQVNTYTMRDQISLPYVLWKHGKSIEYIKLLGDNWRWNPRLIWFPHNWHITFCK